MVGHLAFYGAGFFEMQGYVVTEGGLLFLLAEHNGSPWEDAKPQLFPVSPISSLSPKYLRCSVWF